MNDAIANLSVNRSHLEELRQHLIYSDTSFFPSLSTRVDLETYAKKIYDRANRFEAWDNGNLIGLVAVYCDNHEKHPAFITNVSVLPTYQGKGIASQLMNNCLEYIREQEFGVVELEVNQHNLVAVAVYQKYGFSTTCTKDQSLIMTLELE